MYTINMNQVYNESSESDYHFTKLDSSVLTVETDLTELETSTDNYMKSELNITM